MAMRIAVAIPCYKVTRHVLGVIAAIGPAVERIYAVDDACPDGSGKFIEEYNHDERVRVLYHPKNRGVGGAVVTAYQAALADDMDIVVKIDGDGQMNPALIPHFVRAIVQGKADYTKGNRFFRPESLKGMPPIRLFGNAALSFINKLSTGYWPIMDPTNGYTAIHTAVLRELPLDKLERRYFFESDMLYHLSIIRAVVHDVPMDAVYADEESNLKVSRVLPEFMLEHVQRFFKVQWAHSAATGQPASSGTVMLAALPLLIGIQCLIAFLHHDVSSVPTEPLAGDLDGLKRMPPPSFVEVDMPVSTARWWESARSRSLSRRG